MTTRSNFAWTAVLLLLASTAFAADAPAPTTTVVDVWPGQVPGESGEAAPEKTTAGNAVGAPIKLLTNVTHPTLTIYKPDSAIDTHASVVICPGGGYSILAWDLEGEEVATWLNSIGVTGILVKYRVPARKDDPEHLLPLKDAQRTISLVRSKAKDWNLDPKKIGILGFSAGGNLAAKASTHFDQRAYEAIDDVDQASCRPDFTVLVYPAWLVDDKKAELKAEFPVTAQTPPAFCAHAANDGISPDSSIEYCRALRHAKVPADLHVYSTGGHGFGLRPSAEPCSTWPQRCEEWMRSQKIIPAKPAASVPSPAATSR